MDIINSNHERNPVSHVPRTFPRYRDDSSGESTEYRVVHIFRINPFLLQSTNYPENINTF